MVDPDISLERLKDRPTLTLRSPIRIVLAAGAVALLAPVPALASCSRSYSYAGLVRRTPAAGMQADLTPLASPTVTWGHVAAWVGVGGIAAAPGGSNSWLQVGLDSTGTGTDAVYYEVTRPGGSPAYTQLLDSVAVGERHRVAVLEMAGRPGSWRIWLDGRAVTAPIDLPGSHKRWSPMAMTESWNGGHNVCNSFRYGFSALRVAQAPGGSWTTLADAYPLVDVGLRLLRTGSGSFVATAAG